MRTWLDGYAGCKRGLNISVTSVNPPGTATKVGSCCRTRRCDGQRGTRWNARNIDKIKRLAAIRIDERNIYRNRDHRIFIAPSCRSQ